MSSFIVPQIDIPNINIESLHFDKITFSKVMLDEIDKNGYITYIYLFMWFLPIVLCMQCLLMCTILFYISKTKKIIGLYFSKIPAYNVQSL